MCLLRLGVTIHTYLVRNGSRALHLLFYMKQSAKKGKKNQIGAWGEEIAAQFIKKHNLTLLECNYLKKWGEIDIVARGTKKIHFIEVKTVSYETKSNLETAIKTQTYRPEENVHYRKLQRLHRAIESWLMENNCRLEWQIDVVSVRLVPHEKYATAKYLPNCIN